MKKFLLTYFVFLFSFFIFFASGFVDSQDGLQYLTIARRLYYDHTVEMPTANYNDNTNIHFNVIHTADGKHYSPTGIGYSIAMLPAVVLEDILLRTTGADNKEAFPLENDWPVLLFASMTNSFFGALFVVSFYYYFRLLEVRHRHSLFLSFFLSIATSIFIYTKHTFAHMMFVSFMTLSFIFFKKYSLSKNKIFILLSGVFFGLTLISYNSTYFFVIPGLGIYYILLNFKSFIPKLLSHIVNGIIFIIGASPFYLFNNFYQNLTNSNWVSHQLSSTLSWLRPYVFVEGFWGILFSPGKSIFLYSPIIIILVLFWHKLEFKKYAPEIIAALTVFLTYFYFIGTLLGNEDFLLWHGDSSFGNRYMLPVFPLLLVLIGLIFVRMSKRTKHLVFLPILAVSMLVQVIGISQPYQIRFAGLQLEVQLNGRGFNVYEYGNIIPRYSPLLSMGKKFVRKLIDSKRQLISQANQIKFYDGFGYPFGAGDNYWRSQEPNSLLKVPKDVKLAIKFINHQIEPDSTYSAQLSISNGDEKRTEKLIAGQEKIIELNTKSNLVYFNKIFEGTTSASIPKQQVVFITQAWVNNVNQNLNTIDYPYVSSVSEAMMSTNYYNWGNLQKDPWSIWHMHSGVYEKTFDLWWLRPLQYWDLPKNLFAIMFVTNIYFILYFGYKSAIYSE